MIIFPVEDSEGVTPRLRPQVVYAETVSNRRSFICLSGSAKFSNTKLNVMVITDNKIMANALLTDSAAIRLRKISIDSFPRASAKIFSRSEEHTSELQSR